MSAPGGPHAAYKIFGGLLAALLAILVGAAFAPWAWWGLVVVLPLVAMALLDTFQAPHTLRRNFPLLGRLRYLLESLRPEMQQYFVESEMDGRPFSRELRSVVYQRAKGQLDTLPFGTQHDVYAPGYEWIAHSLAPAPVLEVEPKVIVGQESCSAPYACSRLIVSAMSFGSLSSAAIRALNGGALQGGFAHNTGEGGISPYHLEAGGDLIWQVGTGYFGCRTPEGDFDPDRFASQARLEQVKMIEVKISQGAKPARGGILPAAKVSPEIARIRGVPEGEDVISPPAHSAFSGPEGMLEFLALLRDLSGGKPVGIKLCVGNPTELFAAAKAIHATGLWPDFISVDGGEGGTGAAPLEFSNRVGMPLDEGLSLVDNALRGVGVRNHVKVVASGKIVTGFHMFRSMALGADICASARAMMLALGCIQARECNRNTCPTGITTHDPWLVRGLVPADKAVRVARFHHETVHSFLSLLGAAGLAAPEAITPGHVLRRLDPQRVVDLGCIYPRLADRALLEGKVPPGLQKAWDAADPSCFAGVPAYGEPAITAQ